MPVLRLSATPLRDALRPESPAGIMPAREIICTSVTQLDDDSRINGFNIDERDGSLRGHTVHHRYSSG